MIAEKEELISMNVSLEDGFGGACCS